MRAIFILSIILLLCKSNSSFSQTAYTFNGNGNWSDSANWVNRLVPPIILPSDDSIFINPSGVDGCILDVPQIISPGAFLKVQTGKKLGISSNLIVDPGESLLGLNESDPDSLLSIPILDTASFFPQQQSLDPFFELDMPDIGDQGSEGSCLAFACAYAARSYLLHRDGGISYYNASGGLDYSRILSPEYLYNLGKDPGNCKLAGMNYFNAFKILETKGVSTWSVMPYSSSDGCTTQPNAIQNENALLFKTGKSFRIKDISEAYIKSVLQNKNPILIGVFMDEAFHYLNYLIVKIWKSQLGLSEGKHAMVITGWDDNKHAYKVMNSWGTKWGDGGYGWIDYDYLKEVLMGLSGNYEAYVLKTIPPATESVQIGTQTWTTKNLDVDHYKNGDQIPQVQDSATWVNLTTGAWCYYKNDPSNGAVYGKLYNWYAVIDPRGLAPAGWHIPTLGEWSILTDHYWPDAGSRMKEAGLAHWKSPNTGADNSSGFTALPGGSRNHYSANFAEFQELGYYGSWWTSTTTHDLTLRYNITGAQYSQTSNAGVSVRCIKD